MFFKFIFVLTLFCGRCRANEKDVEISEATAEQFKADFISSESGYFEAGRQALFSNDALVQHTRDLFGSQCNLAWNLEEKREINFTSPNYGRGNYPTNFSCHLSFTGSERCIPVMSCPGKIDLRSSLGPPCANEYLMVSDGLGGQEKFCGGMNFRPIKATGAGRDLYIQIQTSAKKIGGSKSGFRCNVRCILDGEKVKSLEKVDDGSRTVHQCVCGYQNFEDRIVGGVGAGENEFPWMGAIVLKGARSPVCGGSLINDRWLLTAAHCFFNTNYTSEDLDVLLHADLLDMLYLENADEDVALGQKGSTKGPGWDKKEKSDKDEHSKRYEIERIVLHPLYTKKYDYDVALVQIKPKIDFSSMNAPTPICLPRIGNYKKDFKGEKVTVTGWGKAHEKAGASTRKLQKLEGVPVLDFEDCAEMVRAKFQLTDRMVCAGFVQGGKDACTGDSGGPLIYKEGPNRYRQIGIVSFGHGCARRKSPGIYAKVSDFSQWIIYHANQVNPLWCRDTI